MTFGTGGTVSTEVGISSESVQVKGVIVQSDGRILVATDIHLTAPFAEFSRDRFLVARYSATGEFDSTFVAGGRLVIEAMALQPDGKILVAGTVEEPSSCSSLPASRSTTGCSPSPG